MNLTAWMDHYGYLVLFLVLMVELIAAGIPTEILMSYAGFLVYQGRLGWIPSILSAAIGSSIGISIAYWIGRKLGYPFFHKYGSKVHLGPDKLDRFSDWFGKYGNGLITIAYFIPGIRHVTGYFSGITKVSFVRFAIFAYLGAFLWSGTFISVGRVLGPQWDRFHNAVSKYLLIIGVSLFVIMLAVFLYRRFKRHILERIHIIQTASPARVRWSIIGAAVVFVVFLLWMIALIQDYAANESTQFNTITMFSIHAIFGTHATWFMRAVSILSSPALLIVVVLVTVMWILLHKTDRILELSFLCAVVLGSMFLEEGLQNVFGRIGSHRASELAAFPSDLSLVALSIWGFFGYLVAKLTSRAVVSFLAFIAVIAVTLFVGISRIYLSIQAPSDILAGYVFAGVWLSLNVMLLDTWRELRRIRLESAQPC